jgi:hypothetical protein
LFSFRKSNFEGYLAQYSTSRNSNGKIKMVGDASDAGFLLPEEMVEGLPATQLQDSASGSSPMVGRNSTEQAMAASVIQPQIDRASDSEGAVPWGSSMLSQFVFFLSFGAIFLHIIVENPFAFALCERTCG